MENFEKKEEGLPGEILGEEKRKKGGRKKGIILVVILIVILVILAVIFGFSGKLGGNLASFSPAPAARIGNGFISGWKFQKNYLALKRFYASQEGQEEKPVSDEEIKKMTLDRLIEDKIILGLARKFKVKVKKEDIEKEYKYVLEEYENEEELIKEIQELYDWTVKDFKDEVLVSSLYYDLLRKAYLMDNKIDSERKKKDEKAKKKAEEAMAKLKSGEDFAKLAKEVSEDDFTAKDGGDLGWFEREEMEIEFEEAAFKLNPGEMSDIIRTEEGYHIIKVEKKKGQGDKEEVKASHILFKVKDDFDKWFLEEKKKITVKIYLDNIKWDKEQAAIEGMSEGEEELNTEDIEIENVVVEPVK